MTSYVCTLNSLSSHSFGSAVTLAPLTEIQTDSLYFCLEHRYVEVCGQPISLTVKEFEILALLIKNPKRVFRYEMLWIWYGMRITPAISARLSRTI